MFHCVTIKCNTFLNLWINTNWMKFAHNVVVSVFVKENENKALIKESLLKLFPFEIKNQYSEELARSYEGVKSDIFILRVELNKDNQINSFLKYLKENIYDCDVLIKQIDSRLDNDYNFFIRLDKNELINGIDGRLKLTDAGNCCHIKVCIAAYPKNRESAIKIVNEIFRKTNI